MDTERINDRLLLSLASTPERKEYVNGYIAGKTRARIEVVVICLILLLVYFFIAE